MNLKCLEVVSACKYFFQLPFEQLSHEDRIHSCPGLTVLFHLDAFLSSVYNETFLILLVSCHEPLLRGFVYPITW